MQPPPFLFNLSNLYLYLLFWEIIGGLRILQFYRDIQFTISNGAVDYITLNWLNWRQSVNRIEKLDSVYCVKIQLIELMQFIESLDTHVPFDKIAIIDTIESIYQIDTTVM